jgi:hypothetical protein
MRPRYILALALALTAIVLAGCAGLQEKQVSKADRVCVRIDRIYSFNGLDDNHVYVNAGTGDHYLFTVDQSCIGLRFARAIRIADSLNRVCGDGFTFLTFNHPGAGTMRCRIIKIDPVEDENAARTLIEQ